MNITAILTPVQLESLRARITTMNAELLPAYGFLPLSLEELGGGTYHIVCRRTPYAISHLIGALHPFVSQAVISALYGFTAENPGCILRVA